MTDDKIIDEKIQLDINREAAEISSLSSGKIDKDKYITGTGKEILPFHQSRILQQANSSYSPLGKEFERQIK